MYSFGMGITIYYAKVYAMTLVAASTVLADPDSIAAMEAYTQGTSAQGITYYALPIVASFPFPGSSLD